TRTTRTCDGAWAAGSDPAPRPAPPAPPGAPRDRGTARRGRPRSHAALRDPRHRADARAVMAARRVASGTSPPFLPEDLEAGEQDHDHDQGEDLQADPVDDECRATPDATHHIAEVLAEVPGDERQGQEDGRHHGELL